MSRTGGNPTVRGARSASSRRDTAVEVFAGLRASVVPWLVGRVGGDLLREVARSPYVGGGDVANGRCARRVLCRGRLDRWRPGHPLEARAPAGVAAPASRSSVPGRELKGVGRVSGSDRQPGRGSGASQHRSAAVLARSPRSPGAPHRQAAAGDEADRAAAGPRSIQSTAALAVACPTGWEPRRLFGLLG